MSVLPSARQATPGIFTFSTEHIAVSCSAPFTTDYRGDERREYAVGRRLDALRGHENFTAIHALTMRIMSSNRRHRADVLKQLTMDTYGGACTMSRDPETLLYELHNEYDEPKYPHQKELVQDTRSEQAAAPMQWPRSESSTPIIPKPRKYGEPIDLEVFARLDRQAQITCQEMLMECEQSESSTPSIPKPRKYGEPIDPEVLARLDRQAQITLQEMLMECEQLAGQVRQQLEHSKQHRLTIDQPLLNRLVQYIQNLTYTLISPSYIDQRRPYCALVFSAATDLSKTLSATTPMTEVAPTAPAPSAHSKRSGELTGITETHKPAKRHKVATDESHKKPDDGFFEYCESLDEITQL